MSIASIGSRDAAYSALLSSRLQAQGLSSQKTALVLGDAKVAKTMREYKRGTLRSGSKGGPKVRGTRHAIAIALSQQRRARDS